VNDDKEMESDVCNRDFIAKDISNYKGRNKFSMVDFDCRLQQKQQMIFGVYDLFIGE
jgi:hypothetical protein